MRKTCENCYNYYHASGRTLQMFDHCMEAENLDQDDPQRIDLEKIFDGNNKNNTCTCWMECPEYRKHR